MSQRGALLIAWDAASETEAALLARAIAALQQVHPELPHLVVRRPGGTARLDKARVLAETPFETTLYLDSEAVVLGRLEFGFEMAERYGLACCLGDNPWRRRHVGASGDGVEYDTGLLFLAPGARPVLEMWQRMAPVVDLPVSEVVAGKVEQRPCDDRLGFALALDACGIAPFVLPLNWALRPGCERAFFGPVKTWCSPDPVPDWLVATNRYYEAPGSIVQFHELAAQQ